MKASANDTLPANARQVMYAARPYIEQRSDKPLGSRFDQYFTQQLLPDYIEERGVDWDVVYDDRGHFREPHDDHPIGLGTLNVRSYLTSVRNHEPDDEVDFDLPESAFSTRGPCDRFGAILFIEKEGFMPLFEAVKLAERFDLAIMSTKGVSVTAARQLVDELCGEHEIPLLVLHDFDKSGFTIVGTLQRDTRRYSFENAIEVVDLGLRLERHRRAAIRERLQSRQRLCGAVESDRERRDRGRGRISPAPPRRAQRDDQSAAHRVHRAEAASGRRREDRARPGDAGKSLSADAAPRPHERADRGLAHRGRRGGRCRAIARRSRAQIDALLVEHPEMAWDAALRRISRPP